MIELFNPAAYLKQETTVYTPTPFTLKGKRVGLLSNSKPNVDLLYEYMAKRLPDQFQPSSLVWAIKANATQPASPDIIQKLSQEADVVINAIGD